MNKFLLLLFLPILLVVPSGIEAQANPITWTVVPGFNGTFKMNAWLPVTVTVGNSGNDIRGRLEWRWQLGPNRYSQTIDLPRGARKRIVIPVQADAGGGTAQLTLYNGETVVATQNNIRFNIVEGMNLVVGVLSDGGDVLPEVGGISAPGRPTNLVRLTSADVPERPELLQSLDILFLHGTDTTRWNEAQQSALALWVAGGGVLVVGGDRAVTATGITPILPAQVTEASQPARLAALSATTGWEPRDAEATLPALQLTPKPDARVVSATSEGRPLLVRRQHGSGAVIQAAFDLQALSRQGNPVPLWERLFVQTIVSPQWTQMQGNEPWILRQSVARPALRLPSIWSLIAFLSLYIGLVGPANYLVLRRIDRREWAYLTIPLAVALFTLGAYVVGAVGRGGNATGTALTTVTVAPDSTTGQATSHLGIYSPNRHTYQLSFAPDTLVRDSMPMFRASGESGEVLRTESAVEVPAFFVDVGAMRPLSVHQIVPAPQLHAVVTKAEDGWVVDIENRGSQSLSDAVVQVGQSFQMVGELAPGQRQSVRLNVAEPIPPALPGRDGVINRTAVLEALQNSAFMTIPPDEARGEGMAQIPPERVTLAAWSGRPSVGAQVDGTPLAVQGDTVYLWPLGSIQR